MNKADTITMMTEFTGGTKVESERNLEALLGIMEYCIKNNEKLNLVGYFSMEVKDTKERKGRNPSTKEEIIIPAGKKVKLKCGKKLKDLA